MNTRISTLAALLASSFLLAACGGTSGATMTTPASGTVGGTVTGLATGASLVLRNNGANDLAIPANGSFTFSMPMARGGAYAVTVQHQPTSPSQTCTVANGTGMMGSGNMISVAVTCATNSYTVGGTVIGLQGTGLALAIPGQSNLTVAPGATTFSFPSPMQSGTSYAVTVATQPSGPAQACAVGGGTGTMGNAHVSSVVVNCSTSQFLVGGTVSGLAGTGLVLTTAGQADLALPAGATSFAFGSPMTSTSAYAVTVKTQPASPAQTCSVTGGSGTVGSGNPTGIAVTCAYAVSGTVVKGPVSGATVTAYAVTNGTMGAQIGGGTTDSMGNFSVSVGDYSGPMMLQASGGTYTDEATGTTATLQAGDVLACAIPSAAVGGSTAGVQVTPVTSMAHSRVHHMTGGITDASMVAANADMGGYFSVTDILHTVPMNPMVAGSGASATQAEKNYGLSIAAMSQYAKTIGMTTSSSGMVTAMTSDASDGVMDGMMGGTAISMAGMGGMMGGMMSSAAGTSGLSTAMRTFIGSALNRSGVTTTDMQALMNQLAGSNGQLPGAGGTVSLHGTMTGAAFMGGFPRGR